MKNLFSFSDFLTEGEIVTNPPAKTIADFLEKSVSGLGTNEDGLVGSIELIDTPDKMIEVNQLMSKGDYSYKTVGDAMEGELDLDDGYYKSRISGHLKKIKAEKFIKSISKPGGSGSTQPNQIQKDTIVKEIIPRVKKHEGVKPKVYKDSRGFMTVGVGMKLSRGDADKVLKSVGANPQLVKAGKQALTTSQMDKILIRDLMDSQKSMERVMPNFASLPPDVQGVLIEMNFNLGTTGLLKFSKFLDLIKKGKYEEASKEMLKSKWAIQVGDRAKTLASVIASAG